MARRACLGILVLLCVVGLASADGELDGRRFAVNVVEPGGESETADTLVFEDGRFFSTACEEYGFEWADYSSGLEDGVVSFEVSADSETEGTNLWVGRVDGDEIEGTFIWTKDGQDPIEYSFAGRAEETAESN